MPDDEPYARALRDPEFLRRFDTYFAGEGDPLDALRRYSEPAAVDTEAAALLYGRDAEESARERIAATLGDRRELADRVEAALAFASRDEAAASNESVDAGPSAAGPSAAPIPAIRRRANRRWLVAIIGVACAVVGFAAGSATTSTPRVTAPSPSAGRVELPQAITYDNRDGQQALLIVQSAADPRAETLTLPRVAGGYDIGTACLAKARRPASLPVETVLLLSSSERLIGSWQAGCDGNEHRFHALAETNGPQVVHLVIVVDTAVVGAAWVTLNPAGT